VIVGGQMFIMTEPLVLDAYGDRLDQRRWWPFPAPGTEREHDFRAASLRDTPWLHQRADVDFTGWWACLVPVQVLQRAGLTLPVFIKWDDVEYGLRARSAGCAVVTLPGAAVWHMPWHSKDLAAEWQVYFQTRNRLVTALLHSPHPEGGTVLDESMIDCVRRAMSLQYGVLAQLAMAIEDVLRGPSHLHESMLAKPAEIKRLRERFPDAGLRAQMITRHLRLVVPFAHERWWETDDALDGYFVDATNSTGGSWPDGERERFVAAVRQARELHSRLRQRWPQLAQEYRDALPELVGPKAWAATFKAASAVPPR
jgi:galactofuranosylgalactofuranosylrhamnosyl-N-acetylglucosaminyl-diphospho-decaprenol beta-1,5/1,6-galactofuranosyltransferase